jgi:hypothetical protein
MAQTGAETIAVGIADKFGLAVDNGNRALGTSGYAIAAAIAFFVIDLYDIAHRHNFSTPLALFGNKVGTRRYLGFDGSQKRCVLVDFFALGQTGQAVSLENLYLFAVYLDRREVTSFIDSASSLSANSLSQADSAPIIFRAISGEALIRAKKGSRGTKRISESSSASQLAG